MISETIYNGKEVIFSMADVQHIEKQKYSPTSGKEPNDFRPNGAFLITKHTQYNKQADMWENPIWISEEELPTFLKVWCIYRSEVDYPFDVTDWMPIDNAPKDGTEVIIYDPVTEQQYLSHWSNSLGNGYWHIDMAYIPTPTHFKYKSANPKQST